MSHTDEIVKHMNEHEVTNEKIQALFEAVDSSMSMIAHLERRIYHLEELMKETSIYLSGCLPTDEFTKYKGAVETYLNNFERDCDFKFKD